MISVKVCTHCGKAKTKKVEGKIRKSNRKRSNKNIKYSL